MLLSLLGLMDQNIEVSIRVNVAAVFKVGRSVDTTRIIGFGINGL